MTAAVGAVICYSKGAVPPVVPVIVIVEVFVGQLSGELENIRSVGGSNGEIVISFVIKLQSLASLIVTV